MGFVFGHKFHHAYDVDQNEPVYPDGMWMRLEGDATSLTKSYKKTYRHSICNRCGMVIDTETPKENKNAL